MQANRPIVKINSVTNIAHFYNSDGSQNGNHPNGFYNGRDLGFYKENYNVIFI